MASRQKDEEERITGLAAAEAALAGMDYQKSEEVAAAERALADYTAQKPAAYQSTYQGRIEALTQRILSREPFVYSFDADPLYQQYRDSAVRGAKLALQDTAATAAGLTGGYGSSYGTSAAGQAAQQRMAELGDLMPELYQAAWERYTGEEAALQKRLAGLEALEKDAVSAYNAQMDDYYAGLKLYTETASDAYDRDMKQYQNRLNALQDLRDYYAGQEQQQAKNELAQKQYELTVKKFEESIRQWEAEQALAREKWLAQQQAAIAKAAEAAKGGTGGSGGSAKTGGSGGSAKTGSALEKKAGERTKGTSGLSDAAKKVQATLQNLIRAGGSVGGLRGADRARATLNSYLNSGTITRSEAEAIARSMGFAL